MPKEACMKKDRVGIVFGCFIPLHTGHMAMIDRALRENDEIVLGVTGYDMDRGRDCVPFLRRALLMRQIYGHDPHVHMAEVDDRAIGLTGTFSEEAWRAWGDSLFFQAKIAWGRPDTTYTWYTADQGYVDKLRLVYPEHEFVLLDRGPDGISGTTVRENLASHVSEIHPVFVDYLRRQGLLPDDAG